MVNPEKKEILRPGKLRIFLIFLALFFIFEIIFVLSFLSSLEETFVWFTPILAVVTFAFGVFAYKQISYEVTSNKIIHSKMGKVTEYFWTDIIYIDEEFSEKHKMMLFYTKDGKDHYLLFDKHRVIYETALAKVHQLTPEEFKRRFPHIKQ